ncbi:MAG: alpha/beta fold hydrolase [Rhodobacteraceae bacterium]|jgi:alpha-beta hydrolase superfamily lysophospholipase|nr:alpha/beta fold hydrolase [Paracoccaceae bacterium]
MVRPLGKALGRVLLALVLLAGALWLFAPVEPVDRDIAFDEGALPRDLDHYLAESEARFPDITPGVQKRILWAGAPGARTQIAVVYLHGFSATSEEIRPVPDRVAEVLGANLYFARLAGHGRPGAAMAEATAGDWLEDTAEALAIGRRIGREVLVIATSTGGTLAAIAATDASLIDAVKGIVFVSPNFRLQNPAAPILTMPFGRHWGPLVAGAEIGFEPLNEAHGRYWTSRYPSVAAFPMGALVRHARGLDYSGVTTPALFVYAEADSVVSAAETRRVAARWGGIVEELPVELPEGDDPYNHVLAGDILSPGSTEATVDAILGWVLGL